MVEETRRYPEAAGCGEHSRAQRRVLVRKRRQVQALPSGFGSVPDQIAFASPLRDDLKGQMNRGPCVPCALPGRNPAGLPGLTLVRAPGMLETGCGIRAKHETGRVAWH